MRTIKPNYIMLLVTLLAMPSVLLLCAPSAGLFATALGVAVLAENLIADRGENNPLYEDAAEVQDSVSDEMKDETVVIPNYFWAR